MCSICSYNSRLNTVVQFIVLQWQILVIGATTKGQGEEECVTPMEAHGVGRIFEQY